MDKEERSVRKKHRICFSFDCVLGLPAFFPGIIPDLQPVYKVNNHNIRYQWQTTRKKIAELTVFVLRLKNKCKWFTCNTCLTVLASGRCGSWILQRCQTRFSSLPHGAFTVSSWWVLFIGQITTMHWDESLIIIIQIWGSEKFTHWQKQLIQQQHLDSRFAPSDKSKKPSLHAEGEKPMFNLWLM